MGLTVPVSGGDEVYRVEIELAILAVHETMDDLLEELEAAWTEQDSAAYAWLLDSRFEFENWPEPGMDTGETWSVEEDLRIAGNMFALRANNDGRRVEGISLQFDLRSSTDLPADYPGIPPGETWHEARALAELIVVVEDPTSADGFTNFVVVRDQVFIVRPSPHMTGRYRIMRHEEQEPLRKNGLSGPPATEDASWGAIKNLWRQSLP